MAKTQKYSDDLLLEAVVRYSEIFKNKIKATELAAWARDNISGLEDVRDYNFTRPFKECDYITGKLKIRQKLCTARINDINNSRSITSNIRTNELLYSVNIDAMFSRPVSVQKRLVIETREIINSIMKKNSNLERENRVLRETNKEQAMRISECDIKIKEIMKNYNKTKKQVSGLLKTTDERNRKNMIAESGIEDGSIDLNVYKKSIEKEMQEIFNINQAISKYMQREFEELNE